MYSLTDETKGFFATQLCSWYQFNQRDLPWRNTRNPYHILLSEIILQQTRVEQGLPYYNRFTTEFPEVADLANAAEAQVLRLWQGLGYYSRARNLHTTAKQIVAEFGGIVPDNFKDLITLKGIGTYTASAIASFAYHQHHAVVDGNVYRVLARVFGIHADIASGKGVKEFQLLADELLPHTHSATYNQAIMEFGAVHCTPKNPSCSTCIFMHTCVAYSQNLQGILPIKTKKLVKKNRFLNYVLFKYQDQYGVSLRQTSDIWQGLYDFWLMPHATENANEMHVMESLAALGGEKILLSSSKIYKHLLTHQNLFVKFFVVEIFQKTEFETFFQLKFHKEDEILALPKPILITRFLEQNIFC